MTTLAIRKKLSDYLQIADDKKVKAMYALLEDDIKQFKNVSIDEYNKEIDEALAEANTSSYITQEQMEKQAARW